MSLLIQPSPELQIHIRKELNEDVNTRDSDLQAIKDWLQKQPHLPDTWDEVRIMNFLRGCKFSLEKCKKKLDMYFTMRSAIPEFFTNRDISRPELQEIAKIGQGPPLPGLTPDGKRVTIMRAVTKDFETPNIADAMKIALMIGDIRLAAEEVGVAGDVYILDASVASVNHFSKITPTIVKKFLVCVQEAYPVKVKEVHIVNASPIVDTIINWVKPFIKEKIRNRIHIHADLESLYKFVPKEILPEEYGGTAGKMADFSDQWLKKLAEYTSWFKEQENIKADESKRPGKPTNYEDLFGLDGSFRQLTID
ncbi:CRAL TRIO domain containing protein [Asbolus verrucosus]|uniref:CRAL TRIO domain containing protein n=1 Tax=Asbolus verrucosus TaxID=1661398 RepID=A0A482V625_ASBVE|nr:CRAL TRIO domain containing protein [Asbolus verrucosus]